METWFGGRIMKTTMKAKKKVEQLGQQLIAGTFAPRWGVFVGRRPPTWLRPPACKNSWKQSVTHTLSRFAALWRKNLNRHLKSLSKERKKSRKSSAKGQERKIGVAEGEYLALDWGRETSFKNHLKSLKESPRNDEKHKKESAGQGGGVCPCVCTCVCLNT